LAQTSRGSKKESSIDTRMNGTELDDE